jgi:RAP1 GTPase activating protein 1
MQPNISSISSDLNYLNSQHQHQSINTKLQLEYILNSTKTCSKLPMIVKSLNDGYWIEGEQTENENDNVKKNDNSSHKKKISELKIASNDVAKFYRQYFYGREHFNLIGNDENLGPILMSLKPEMISDQLFLRILLRLREGTTQDLISEMSFRQSFTALHLGRLLNDKIQCESYIPIVYPFASNLIAAYDEHQLVSNFKFGVLYQKFGQTTEEELFANNETCSEFEEFLELLGNKIKLREHKGYRGGLDIQNGHTGDVAIYEVFENRDIIFHVSTMLPYTNGDPQQLQRKRHIGNDIVTIVFQEESTPFSPDMIASHFLHAFIVIQPFTKDSYKICVAARNSVPFFGPSLPQNGVISKDNIKQFLLTKLINAENACYKAEKFAKLEFRTRSSLLQNLVDDLKDKTAAYLGTQLNGLPESPAKMENSGTNRFLDSFKKAFTSKMIKGPQEGNTFDFKKQINSMTTDSLNNVS